jgi:hypothetical protein
LSTRWPKYSAAKAEEKSRAKKKYKSKMELTLRNRYMKLIEHRTNLSKNENAYTYDVYNKTERLIKSLIPHLKKAGYAHISFSKHREFSERNNIFIIRGAGFYPVFSCGRNGVTALLE